LKHATRFSIHDSTDCLNLSRWRRRLEVLPTEVGRLYHVHQYFPSFHGTSDLKNAWRSSEFDLLFKVVAASQKPMIIVPTQMLNSASKG
jgi:hypothetical protein